MSEIVVVNHGTIVDRELFRALVDQATELVRRDLPGTVRYDCYVDAETSRFVFDEAYEDSEALLQHARRMAAAGLMERFPRAVEFEAAFALGEVAPEARQMLEPMGFVCLGRLGQLTR